MAYSFEMVLVGMILLTAMLAGGITLGMKRRREAGLAESSEGRIDTETSDNPENAHNR